MAVQVRTQTRMSEQLYKEAVKYLPGGNSRHTVYNSPFPIYARSGKGCMVTDVDGVERIDFINNYTSLIHGHAHPKLIEASIEQLQRGTAFGFATESEIRLARLLQSRVPSFQRTRFTNSGSEAVMMAVKAARAFTGRSAIAKFEGCYHGSYDFVEVSTTPDPALAGPEEAPNTVAAYPGQPKGVVDDVVVMPFNNADAAERLIDANKDRLACVLVDPVPNRAGLMAADQGFIKRLREVTRRHGILLLFDEVFCFRVDYRGAQHLFDIDPEVTAIAKIIGGGFPVGAVCGREDVMAVFDPRVGHAKVPHGGTFNANPMTMAVGAAGMELMTEAEYERINGLGQKLRDGANAAFKKYGVPGQATGTGSLARIHGTDVAILNYRATVSDPQGAARLNQIWGGLNDRGVAIAPGGLACTSTPMNESHIDTFIGALEEVVSGMR